MLLKSVDVFDSISPEEFKMRYYDKGIPVVIKNLSHQWPAYQKWNWGYFKEAVGKYSQKKKEQFNKIPDNQ